tara:strand:+ start:746 stop:1510 length:765 start_codon:yes stop_codon:yes gene_type:complete
MLEISIIKCLEDNYSYLIKDKKTNLVAVVDPSEFQNVDEEISKKYKKLDFILNTHYHSDHVGGNLELKNKYSSKIVCSAYDRDKVPGADIKKKDNEYFVFGETKFKIIHVPGHTLDHIIFFSEIDEVLFSGDTLFSLGCGRIFEGSYEQMFSSLEKIKKLPDKTKIYCGHEYTNNNGKFCIEIDKDNSKLKKRIKEVRSKIDLNEPTIPSILQDEIETNIFLRYDDKKIKKSMGIDNASNIEVFKKLRNLKDQF